MFRITKKSAQPYQLSGFFTFGGDKRDRTAGLLNAIQALSQLSYTPINMSTSIAYIYQIVK